MPLAKARVEFIFENAAEVFEWLQKNSGYNVRSFAKEMEISEVTVFNWLGRKNSPTFDRMLEIIDKCGYVFVLEPKDETDQDDQADQEE